MSVDPFTRRLFLSLVVLAGPASAGSRGRPKIVLDRLDFPKDIAGARYYRKRLRRVLRREVRRVKWGAGRKNTIQYRFAVTKLDVAIADGVLRVRCTAIGRLPGGRKAKSHLSFGGDPRKKTKEISRVLEIVARGVVTRLAELERVRRGDIEKSRVRKPRSPPD